ncbi:MAG: alpha/beta hydrolase [Gemmatimonadota bacterium]|nr:alpha/beta hydrolase [Gemmatimonadota bacterium]
MRRFPLASALVLLSLVAGAPLPAQHPATGGDYAEVNGVRIHYKVDGTGPPLVLIHGWPSNSEWWDEHVPVFRKYYRVIRYDRRSFGKSGGTPDGTADPADLDALLDRLGVDSAHVLGHAAGGPVALALALNYPRRVRSLILYGSAAPAGFGLPWNGPDAIPFAEARHAARTAGLDSFWAILNRHPVIAGERFSAATAARIDRIHRSWSGVGILRDSLPRTGQVPPPRIDQLREIRVPTLVLTGDREMPYIKVVAEALAYGIPNAKRVTVRGGGHLINASQPAAFNDAVLRFLASVRRPAGR